MAGASSSREVLRHLNTLFHCGTAGQLSDAELLNRFVAGRDEAAEAAFAALVERHGAMVLGVCRRVLGNRHAAEDAFQATFLVLARKASAIARREQLASWLYGVARHTALDARARAIRRQSKEKRLGPMLPVERPDQTETSELRTILDEELACLPERYRAAIVLCELEGLTRRQAAGRLGVSEGTLSSRLARAKERLRDRLTRRGLALSAAGLASALSREAQAVIVAPALVDSTIRVATSVAAGSSLAGVVSTSVATLTEGVLKAMLLAKLKMIVLGVVTVALVTTGVGVVAQDSHVPVPRAPDQDRLKVVEQKLDRLLEVLGGSSRSEPHYAVYPPLPAGAGIATATSGSDSLPTGKPPQSATKASAFALGSTARNQSISGGQSFGAPSTTTAHSQSQSLDLDGRVASLEQRLSELERRFGEMERRLNGLDFRPGQSSPPRGATSSRRRSAIRSDASPFELDQPASDSALPQTSKAASADIAPPGAAKAASADTAPRATTSADSAPETVAPPRPESPR